MRDHPQDQVRHHLLQVPGLEILFWLCVELLMMIAAIFVDDLERPEATRVSVESLAWMQLECL